MIMTRQAIVEFGERLVRHVRDDAVRSCGLTLRPDYQGADGERWRAAAVAGGQILTKMVIPDCVDSAVCHLLSAMDDADLLHLSFITPRGETVDWPVVSWGEPVGWYIGTGEWRPRYSKERFIDDFPLDDPTVASPLVLEEVSPRRRVHEELGQLLVRHVRDVAIRSCDLQLTPQSDTPVARRWRQAALASGGAVPPEVLIPDCVDETILAFLRAIDQGLLPLSFTAQSGETVELRQAGEGRLAERYSEWRARYTKERFADDVPNLAPQERR
jgi:hypothetical protein